MLWLMRCRGAVTWSLLRGLLLQLVLSLTYWIGFEDPRGLPNLLVLRSCTAEHVPGNVVCVSERVWFAVNPGQGAVRLSSLTTKNYGRNC